MKFLAQFLLALTVLTSIDAQAASDLTFEKADDADIVLNMELKPKPEAMIRKIDRLTGASRTITKGRVMATQVSYVIVPARKAKCSNVEVTLYNHAVMGENELATVRSVDENGTPCAGSPAIKGVYRRIRPMNGPAF